MAPGRGRSWGGLATLVHLGTTTFFSVVLGLLGGYGLDGWLGTSPWLTLIGLGFGIAAAAVNFIRALRALERDDH